MDSPQSRLFAYGTLMLPEIWNAVTATPAHGEAATLFGYGRFRVTGADYPAIVATGDPNDSVSGWVHRELSSETFARLDRYEDDFYQRLVVPVTTTADDSPLDCQTYVVPTSRKGVLSGESWDLEWFRSHAQSRFLARLGLPS